MTYEFLDHTADTGLTVRARNLPELFATAARGMFDLTYVLTEPGSGRTVPISVTGDGFSDLMVNWLAELLFEAERNDLAFTSCVVTHIDHAEIDGVATGISAQGLELDGPPIKAVTYHALVVAPDDGGWMARVVFDV